MIFDAKNWKQCVKGFSIIDCAIRTKDMYVFVLSENEPEEDVWPLNRFLMVYADELAVDERFYYTEVSNFRQASIAFHENPNWEFVVTDLSGHVYSHERERDGVESDLPREIPNCDYSSPFTRCVRINESIHAIAWDRRIFRREKMDQWTEITQLPGGIPYDKLTYSGESSLELGFTDVAAFDSSDIYAVGGSGDVWHYNGKKWQQIHFPSNELLFTVCCAGDGNVYITDIKGALWVGRGDRWKRLSEGRFSSPFADTAWFAGRLFCGDGLGLWYLKGDKLVSIRDEVDSRVATSVGRIDISPDGKLMLTAGLHGATIYDGNKWEVLFNSLQFA